MGKKQREESARKELLFPKRDVKNKARTSNLGIFFRFLSSNEFDPRGEIDWCCSYYSILIRNGLVAWKLDLLETSRFTSALLETRTNFSSGNLLQKKSFDFRSQKTVLKPVWKLLGLFLNLFDGIPRDSDICILGVVGFNMEGWTLMTVQFSTVFSWILYYNFNVISCILYLCTVLRPVIKVWLI